MKGSALLSGRPPTDKRKLRNPNKYEHAAIITDATQSDSYFTGSFYIPPSPQKSSSFPVQKLINHLTKYQDKIDQLDLKKLDVITNEIIKKSEDSEFIRILKDHGWNGYRFCFSGAAGKEAASLLQQLSNLYLKQKSKLFANRITEMYGTEDSSAFSQLASFTPNLLLLHLTSSSPNTSQQVTSFSFQGACMLVDISGFSKFSAEMCKQGVNGLDGLREMTNGFLGHFVKKVYEYDGDVIAFAGDALLCVFKHFQQSAEGESPVAAPPPTTHCTYRALECAFALKSHKNQHLSTHIAVSYGLLGYAVLGGVNDQWIGVLNGPPISELSEAIGLAGSQEVVATAACVQYAQGLHDGPNQDIDYEAIAQSASVKVVRVRPSNSSFYRKSVRNNQAIHRTSSRIHTKQADEIPLLEQLMGFVPRPILSAVYSGTINHIGELRQVTTLFLSLDSYDPVNNADPLSLQEFVKIAQEVLSESGGFLRQFLVDDKGCVLIAMWGTPSYTYSNNCSRALYCAALLQHRIEGLSYTVSIGVTTGIVFCGFIGTPQRRDYVGIGSDVNMAARLMSKAQGRILIDDTTVAYLDDETSKLLERGEELRVKGALASIVPFVYSSSTLPSIAVLDTESSKNQVLKRNVMALISKRLDVIGNDAATRVSRMFVSSGFTAHFTLLLAPLGNGNFAAEYFRHCARKRGIACYSVSASPNNKHKPYCLMKQVLQELVGLEHFNTETQQRFMIDLLVNQVYNKSKDHEKSSARASLHLMLGVDWLSEEFVGKSLSPGNMDSQSNNMKLRQAGDLSFYKILSYLLKQSPTALIIENAHWCDELSWQELQLILMGKDLNISILMTMKANNSGASVNNTNNLYDKILARPSSRRGQNFYQASLEPSGLIHGPHSAHKLHKANSVHMINFAILNSTQREANRRKSIGSLQPFSYDSYSPSKQEDLSKVNTKHSILVVDASIEDKEEERQEATISPLRGSTSSVFFHSPPNSTIEKTPPKLPDSSDEHKTDSLKRRSSQSHLTRLSSFFTNRFDRSLLSSPSSLDIKERSKHSLIKRLSLANMTSPLNYSNDSSPMGLSSNSDSYGSPSSGQGGYNSPILATNHYSLTPLLSNVKTISNSLSAKHASKTLESSPSKNTALKLGLDFIPTESCHCILTHPNTTIVKIAGLSEEEVQALLLSSFPSASISTEMVQLVYQISSGNAYWCKQIIRIFQEQGLENINSYMTSNHIDSRSNSLRLLILLRLEKLSTEQQLVLKLASISTDIFTERMIFFLLPKVMKKINVADCLQALIEHDFICKLQEHPVHCFGFQNQIIQSTLYELIPPSDSSVIHGEIAEYIEKEHGQDLRPYYPSLAYHYRSANRRVEACKYAVKSADKALSRGAFYDTLLFSYMACELAESKSEHKVLLQVVELGLHTMSQYDLAEEMYCIEVEEELWNFSKLHYKLLEHVEKSNTQKKNLSLSTPVTESEVKSLDSTVVNSQEQGNEDVQRLVSEPNERLSPGIESPLSPVRLSWKLSFTTLTQIQQDSVTLLREMKEEDVTALKNEKVQDVGVVCCSIC